MIIHFGYPSHGASNWNTESKTRSHFCGCYVVVFPLHLTTSFCIMPNDSVLHTQSPIISTSSCLFCLMCYGVCNQTCHESSSTFCRPSGKGTLGGDSFVDLCAPSSRNRGTANVRCVGNIKCTTIQTLRKSPFSSFPVKENEDQRKSKSSRVLFCFFKGLILIFTSYKVSYLGQLIVLPLLGM